MWRTAPIASAALRPGNARLPEHLEKHRPERPDVCAAIGFEAAGLFRAHVARCPEHHAGLRKRDGVGTLRVVADRLGETEVEDLDAAVGGQLDVSGLEIAMDDAALVRGVECFEDLLRDGQRDGGRHRPARDQHRQIVAADELHNERADRPGVLESVDLRDVRVIQRRERLRLADESLQAILVGDEALRQDLQGDIAIELRVPRLVDLAHAARSESGQDFVGAETSTRRECHLGRCERSNHTVPTKTGPGLGCGRPRIPLTSEGRESAIL